MLRGQVDLSAEIIRGLEKVGLATDVRWPKPERIAARLKDPAMRAARPRTDRRGGLDVNPEPDELGREDGGPASVDSRATVTEIGLRRDPRRAARGIGFA